MSKEIYISLSSGKNKRVVLPNSRTARMGGRRTLLCSLLILTILSLLSMNPLPLNNGSTVAGPGVSTAATSSITMTSTTNTSSVNLTPGGGFKLSDSTATAAYDVISNNFSGYTVKLVASDDAGTLANVKNAAYVINSIPSAVPQTDFVTTSAVLTNKWGIKPNKYYDGATTVTNTNTLLPSPDTNGTILDVTTAPNSTANNYSIAVGAMVDGNTPSGTYSKTTTISVVPNAASYTLTYDKNTTDTVDDMPDSVSGSTTALTLPVSLSSPTRDHFLFLGWCDTATTLVGNADTCTGNTFQPGDNFGIDQTTENVTTLYAMWHRRTYSCTAEYRLQDADGTYPDEYTAISTILPNVPYDDTCSYTTTQDSTLYVNQTVSETVSGPTTLQIDVPRTTFELTINKNDSYIASVSGAGAHRWGEQVTISATPTVSSVFTGWSQTDGETGVFEDTTSASTTFTMPASAATIYADGDVVSSVMQNLSSDQCTAEPSMVTDIRDGHTYTIRRINGTCWMTQNLTFIGKTDDAAGTMTLDSTTSNVPSNYTVANPLTISYTDFSAGNKYDVAELKTGTAGNLPTVWYNYAAASAMTVATSSDSNNSVHDICPAGWRLPDNPGAFTIDDRNAFNPVTGGYYFNKALSTTQFGYWWLSNATSATNRRYIQWSGNSLFTGSNYNHYRYMGYYVRCVLDETPTMQNFTDGEANAMTEGDSLTLKDIRDGQKYTVAKINGNVWMTKNLAIGCNGGGDRYGDTIAKQSLTSADSNLSANWDTPETSLLTGDDSDTTPEMNCSTTYGAWYNYPAATAGTVTGNKNTTEATSDICPKGWSLPTSAHIAALSGTSYVSALSPTYGGHYRTGTIRNSDRGNYWSTTAYDDTTRFYISYYGGNLTVYSNTGRIDGFFIRCVKDTSPKMQDVNHSTLNTMLPNTGDSITLKDARDGQPYTVSKLADGNVWMTQNLRFTGNDLTSSDSNVAADTTINYGSLTSGNSYNEARIQRSSAPLTGVWYNYVAASADTVAGESNTASGVYDVCPKGWRLPTYTETNALISSSSFTQSQFGPTSGGYYYSGVVKDGSAGYWYTSTANGALHYGLNYSSAAVFSISPTGERTVGRFLRCIKDKEVEMQNINYNTLNTLVPNVGDSTTLTDNRDHQKYIVSKLSDGNVWMTQNLRFTGESLDYTTSNVSTEYTPSNPYRPNNGSGYINVSTTTNSDYGVAGIYDSGDISTGVYYNYAAASVGTVTGGSNMEPARYDVCPAGWRLPTHSELSGIRSYVSQFSPVSGGFYSYDSTTKQSPSYGYWTTSTAHEAETRYFTYYNGSALTDSTTSYRLNRRSSTFIRCIYEKATKTMQDFSDSDINAMRIGETQKLKDTRDNQVYDVTKLSDGNVWMTRNLAIGCDGFGGEYGTSNVARTLTPADSNVTANYSLPTDTNANGNSYDNAYTTCSSTYGAYYNYAAVSAGSVTGSSNTTTATSDICPKGWRMPTNTEQSAILGDVSIFNPSKEGFWYNKSFNNNNAGGWWSSVASNATSRYYLRYESALSVYNPSSGRYLGISVRCMKESTSNLSDISTMQEVGARMVARAADGATATLTDTRDGQEYTVKKINDRLWMTQNLRLTGTVSAADSNFTGNDFNVSAYSIDSSDSSYANHCDTTNGYNYACAKDSGDPEKGVYYNFYAASAGTISTSSNTTNATSDICPAGWRLPTYSEMTAMTNTTSVAAFNASITNYYIDGALSNNVGVWWSSTSSSAQNRYQLQANATSFVTSTAGYRSRNGFSIRCVSK